MPPLYPLILLSTTIINLKKTMCLITGRFYSKAIRSSKMKFRGHQYDKPMVSRREKARQKAFENHKPTQQLIRLLVPMLAAKRFPQQYLSDERSKRALMNFLRRLNDPKQDPLYNVPNPSRLHAEKVAAIEKKTFYPRKYARFSG
jgi:hypothetical protein